MWPHGNKTQPVENEGGSEVPLNNDQIEQNQFQPSVGDKREPTTQKTPTNTLSYPSNDATCGMVQKIVDLKDFSMPTNPGQYPFTVSVHQVIDGDENNSIYKCSGSIIDQSVILTSVNCLMDSNARLLAEDEIQVHVAQYSKNFRGPKPRVFDVSLFF